MGQANTLVPVNRLGAKGIALAPEILAQSPLAIRYPLERLSTAFSKE